VPFQTTSAQLVDDYVSPTTPDWHANLVWAFPLSLATTYGIIIIFSSYGYLDVSVPRVYAFAP
jgi:hypothetical protein